MAPVARGVFAGFLIGLISGTAGFFLLLPVYDIIEGELPALYEPDRIIALFVLVAMGAAGALGLSGIGTTFRRGWVLSSLSHAFALIAVSLLVKAELRLGLSILMLFLILGAALPIVYEHPRRSGQVAIVAAMMLIPFLALDWLLFGSSASLSNAVGWFIVFVLPIGVWGILISRVAGAITKLDATQKGRMTTPSHPEKSDF